MNTVEIEESQIIGTISPKIIAPSLNEFRNVGSFIQKLLEDEEFNEKGIAKVCPDFNFFNIGCNSCKLYRRFPLIINANYIIAMRLKYSRRFLYIDCRTTKSPKETKNQ